MYTLVVSCKRCLGWLQLRLGLLSTSQVVGSEDQVLNQSSDWLGRLSS